MTTFNGEWKENPASVCKFRQALQEAGDKELPASEAESLAITCAEGKKMAAAARLQWQAS